ncbi:hypothetical protein KAMAJI_01670 [Serratia phage vB_SmaM-Kamaji]|nr:hypothetical protein KAMAJI_01670 [Serratia phage vB_SmaM-Kamaji]
MESTKNTYLEGLATSYGGADGDYDWTTYYDVKLTPDFRALVGLNLLEKGFNLQDYPEVNFSISINSTSPVASLEIYADDEQMQPLATIEFDTVMTFIFK